MKKNIKTKNAEVVVSKQEAVTPEVKEITNVDYPTVILDLTDENKTLTEAIADCEKGRKLLTPWYKKFAKRVKHLFRK